MHFTKMEGIGNDYLYINGFKEQVEDPAALSIVMSKPHFGCGADGLIMILPSQIADFRMRMFNNDGSESEMCGNGIRCVAKYCYERGLTRQADFTVETGGGIKQMHCCVEQGRVTSVCVDMGAPELDGARIPSRAAGNPVLGHNLCVQGRSYAATLVNMGNPHAVIVTDNPQTAPVTTDGPLIETHEDFPQKTNVEFVHVLDRTHLCMRVWERGTGETLACGTGACAALVACVLNGLCERRAEISLLGGKLLVQWDESDNHVYLTGPATFVYEGEWLGQMKEDGCCAEGESVL
ncbi:MAG: diaminopimelate epimerase [Clostridia bacterium]